jgi:DNA polymerase III delta prime subunit
MVGRKEERARLKALLDAAREGRSGALLLHGPPGIGKTELLRYAVEQAQDFRLIRARGMESESDIPFAGLAELVTPLLAQLDEIPSVQATALRGALALGPATPADRFTVPAALLSLLARAADEQPVLAIVDDTQWLDEPSLEAFLFAGRRLGQEGVAMLGAIRDDATRLEVPWLDRLRVEPLPDGEARALLNAEIAPGVADRLVATAAGNPLALLEIPGLLSSGQLAGREPLEDPLRPGTGVERAFAVAIEALPDATRRALLVASAASTRRLDAIGRGLSQAGLSLADLEPAEGAKIVALADGELEFRHPLLRSTVYHSASLPERRAAHAALAGATDSAERAWHLAACAVAPDEAVAAALEAAALDARGRGAHATAARDLGRAAQLTPEVEPRARRLLAAAGDAVRGALSERALGLLDEAAGLTADPLLAADFERLRGQSRCAADRRSRPSSGLSPRPTACAPVILAARRRCSSRPRSRI